MHTQIFNLLLFGGVRHVPDFVWRSKFFWISLVLLIVGSILYHNFFRKMSDYNFFSRLFSTFSKPKNAGGAKILYSSEGRSGHVHYRSSEANFAMYYEFGGGDCIVSIDIPSVENWEKTTSLPLNRRDETLNFIGQQVVRDQTTGGRGSFKIEGGWLNIYV